MRKTKENDLEYAQIADAFLTLGRETYVKKKFSINENNFKKDRKRDFNKDFKKNKKEFKKPSHNKVNHITASSDEEELLSSSEINKIEHYICCLVGNTPIVEIFLHGITQKALIDTGATTSVLSVKLFNMLLEYSKNKNIKKFTYRPKCPVIIRNASGKEIKSFGIVSLKFGKTNKKSSKTEFIVADLAKDIDIIIGTNLIFSKNNKWILKALNNIQLSEKLTHTVNKISIFDKYPTIIASDDYNKNSEIIEPVALELNDQVIIKEKARPIPFAVKDKVNAMIKQMVNADISNFVLIPGVGHYQFCSLPLGLTVAPGEFQARMEHIFRKQIDDGNVVIYIDDILIAGNSKQECEIILHEVLSILDKYQLKLNPSKCQLFQTQITYLGVELGNGTVKISEKNSNKFLNFSTPTTKKQLASFNGLFNYFRFYIPQAAILLKPLKDAENREKFQ
uniref:Reverse transcriptase domain-containing protein n=1 Tax=Strongyloides papillosus TaxID=174720 RepID=A0A0N5BED6_STREA